MPGDVTIIIIYHITSEPGGSDAKESACIQETWIKSLSWEDALEKGMATNFSILTWRFQ